jgi:hypothetical protein
MNESRASMYSLLTGLAGGALAWAGAEIILWKAASFPDIRALSLTLGAVAGFLLGAVAPTAEGMRQGLPGKAISSSIIGALLGAVFGSLGMALGQFILLMAAEAAAIGGAPLATRGAALARIPGWIVLGTAVGAASGLRSMSPRRILSGAVGGFIGGAIGGVAAELLTAVSARFYGRAAGMVLWGLAVAFLADRMENRRARGRLTVLTGPLKGRSFPVNQRNMTVAFSKRADVPLGAGGVTQVGDGEGAKVTLKGGTVVLDPKDGATVAVNGESAKATELRYDDVVKVGGVTLIYEAKR